MNYHWDFKPLPPSQIIDTLRQIGFKPPFDTLLALRGISTRDEAYHFLNPSLQLLHNPFLMKGMQQAIDRIQKAIADQERILIYGDYDVDGTSAVSLMYRYFSKHTPHLLTYIPDRYTEGYGVSFQGIDYAAAQGCNLIIALDCGIKAVDKVAYATQKGIDFIIADHHRPSDDIPDAVAVLDPHQADCPYPYKELCGCGLGFKIAQAYQQHIQQPFEELLPLLDLVAIATAADIVPMTGENRILMYFGLQQLNTQPSEGVKALFGQHQGDINTSDVVFKAAPRINAAGRIEKGIYAVNLLTENNKKEAIDKVKFIDNLNQERKELDTTIAAEALAAIEANNEQQRYTTVVFNPQWHKGVIGIVASRLIERYYRPTVVFTQSGDKYAASARSVSGFDIYEALEQCQDCIEQFGGHTYAAGLTLRPEQYPLFKETFERVVAQTIPPDCLTPKLLIDTYLPLQQLSLNLYNNIKRFEPFGPMNLSPVFYANNVVDTGVAQCIGKDNSHLRLSLRQVGTPKFFSAIGFHLADKLPIVRSGIPFQIVYTLEEQYWNGIRSLQLQIKDIKP